MAQGGHKKNMLKDMLTYKAKEMNQELLSRAASGNTEPCSDPGSDSDVTTLDSPVGSRARNVEVVQIDSDSSDEQEVDEERVAALADIGNQLESIKASKKSNAKKGYKKSTVTGRWVKT